MRTRIFFRDIDAEDVYALAVLSPRPFGLVNSWDGADKPVFDAARHFNRYRSVEELLLHEMNRWFEPRFERLGLFRMRIERKRPERVEEATPPVTAPRAGARQATAFFEVMLLSEEDEAPLSDVRLEVELPSGERRAVTTNGEGIARLDGLSSSFSSCAVHTAEDEGLTVDAALFPADASATRLPRMLLLHGRAPAAETRTGLVQLRAHAVQKDETVEGIAEKYGLSADVLLQFNFGTNDPEEVEGYLEDHVGWAAPQDREEGAPPVFGGKEVPGLLFIPGPIVLHGLALGRTHRVHVSAVTRVVERVSSTVALDQLAGLATKRGKPFFTAWMASNFSRGETPIPVEAYYALYDDLEAGAFVHPPIRLVQPTARLQGDKKAYVASYDKAVGAIELSIDLVYRAALGEDFDAAWLVLGGLIEEFGHHLDHVLRNHYASVGGDAEGDEGSRFGYLLLNLDWYGQTSAEIGTYEDAEGNTHPVVVDWSELDEKIEELFSEEHQAHDGQDERRKRFGAGMKDESNPMSWGHEAIDRELEGIFRREELPFIVFGNWLRDYSQFVTAPFAKTQRKPSSGVFEAETIAMLIDIVSQQEHGAHPAFRVTAERLGEYCYEEHIDSPRGLSYVRNPRAWSIDERALLACHIATPGAGYECSREYMKSELRKALRAGRRSNDGYRHFGQALHTLQDFYSHTNFCEVMLYDELAARGSSMRPVTWIAPHHRPAAAVDRSALETLFPIVSGTFGNIDTVVSLLHELVDKIEGERSCDGLGVLANVEAWMALSARLVEEILHAGAPGMRTPQMDPQAFADRWRRETEAMLALGRPDPSCRPAHHRPPSGGVTSSPLLFGELPSEEQRGPAEPSGQPRPFDVTTLRALDVRGAAMRTAQDFTVCMIAVLAHQLGEILVGLQTGAGSGEGLPTHSQLSKDDPGHPLHDLAARMAALAVRDVGLKMRDAWSEGGVSEDVLNAASAYFVHPHHIDVTSPQEDLRSFLREWMDAHPDLVAKACDSAWLENYRKGVELARRARLQSLRGPRSEAQWRAFEALFEGANDGR